MRTIFLKKLIFGIALLFSLKGFAQNVQVQQSALIGCWTDSREERTGTNTLYRPCNYKKFPVSRFRFQMELADKGICRYLYLAPNDAHHMVDGSWTFDSKSGLVEIMDLQGKTVHKFKVINLANDLMETESEK